MRKRQITIVLSDDLIEELDRVKSETGMSRGRQIELALKGYKIVGGVING